MLLTLKYAGVVDIFEGYILLQLLIVLKIPHLLGFVPRASLTDVRDRGAQFFILFDNGWKHLFLKSLVIFFGLFILLFEIFHNIDSALALSSLTLTDFLYKVSMEYVLSVNH